MYRQNKFSNESFLSNNENSINISQNNSFTSKSFSKGGPTMNNENDTEEDDDHLIYLKSSGKIINNRHALPLAGGLIVAFKNHSMRNKHCSLSQVCFNIKSNIFALSDGRGQVYAMNTSHNDNKYESIRAASTPISAMCFLSKHKTHLVIAYENGSIIIIDIASKEIIGNLPIKSKSPTRIIRAHPTELLITTVSDNQCISVWDLNTCQCIKHMECEECIVDVCYELDGQVVAVVLENSGLYFYSTMDYSNELLMHLELPSSEPNPRWTAYCSYCVFIASASKGSKVSDAVALNVILAGENSLLYSWHVCISELLQGASLKDLQVQHQENHAIPPYHLVGVVELPLKTRVVVSMQLMNDTDCPPRVCMLFQQGGLLIVDIEGFQLRSVGYYTIRADLSSKTIHGSDASDMTGWCSFPLGVVGSFEKKKKNTWISGRGNNGNHSPSATISSQNVTQLAAYGKLHVCRSSFVLIGCDGVVRWFDVKAAIGDAPTKPAMNSTEATSSLCNTCLRSRIPKAFNHKHSSSQVMKPQSIQSLPPPVATNKWFSSENQKPPLKTYPKHGAIGSRDSPNNISNGTTDAQNEDGETSTNYDFILLNGTEEEREIERNVHKNAPIIRTTRASRAYQKTKQIDIANTNTTSNTTTTTSSSSNRINKATTTSRNPPSHNTNKEKSSSNHHHMQSFVANNSKSKEIDTLHMPLFELAALTSKEKQVNEKKLRSFLELHGEFPNRYRPLIWRFLLKLPENAIAFKSLVLKGIHPGFESLYDVYPIQNRAVLEKLQNVCSQLSHWAPILAEAPYLPALVFPFTLVYKNDELAALETCMSIMMWWGHSWHATHPSPPVHITDSLNDLLKYHDSKLYVHMTNKLGIAPGLLAWTMISTLFTEVLSKSNWLRLMDTLICHFDNSALILLVPIVIMKELKVTLLSTDTSNQAIICCRSQQGVNINAMMKTLLDYMRTTPTKYFSAAATSHIDGQRIQLGKGNPSEALTLSEVEEARENLALSSGKPIFPLTKVRYPVYDGFPVSLLNVQIRERNKILALNKEKSRKESVLVALQSKLEQVEQDHTEWMTKHKYASDAESKYQHDMMEREKKHLYDLVRIEEEISSQRLATLAALENAAKDEMNLMDKAREEAEVLMKDGEVHMKEKMDIALSLQKHRELAELAEVATHERIRQLQMKRIRDDWVKNISGVVKSREDELTTQDAILNEKWKKEDDHQRLLREQRGKQLKAFEENHRMSILQEDLATRVHRLQLEREAKVLEIERTRALRLAKEQAEEALEAAERSAIALRQHDMHTEQEQLAIMQERSIHQAEEKLVETMAMIKTESERLLEAEKVHVLRQNKARIQARQAKLRQEWASKSSEQLQNVLSVQGELQAQMLKLQQAALRGEVERDYTHVGNNESYFEATKQEIEQLEEKVLQQQRQRFSEMQQYQALKSMQDRNESSSTQEIASEWSKLPSEIPAPKQGAGIGFGIGATANINTTKQPSYSKYDTNNNDDYEDDIELEEVYNKLPLDQAVKRASAALLAHNDPLYMNNNNDDDDFYYQSKRHQLLREEEEEGDIRLPHIRSAMNNKNQRQSYRSTNTIKSSSTNALDLASNASDDHNYPHSSSTTSTSSNMNSINLKQLAEESLKNLQSTRALNRDEIMQELQLKKQNKRASSIAAMAATIGTETIDSDTALWALDQGEDSDD